MSATDGYCLPPKRRQGTLRSLLLVGGGKRLFGGGGDDKTDQKKKIHPVHAGPRRTMARVRAYVYRRRRSTGDTRTHAHRIYVHTGSRRARKESHEPTPSLGRHGLAGCALDVRTRTRAAYVPSSSPSAPSSVAAGTATSRARAANADALGVGSQGGCGARYTRPVTPIVPHPSTTTFPSIPPPYLVVRHSRLTISVTSRRLPPQPPPPSPSSSRRYCPRAVSPSSIHTNARTRATYGDTTVCNFSFFSVWISSILRRFFHVRERHVAVAAAAPVVSTRVNGSHAYRSAAAVDAAIRPFGIGASRPGSPPMVMFAKYRFYHTLGPHGTVGPLLLLFCRLYGVPYVRRHIVSRYLSSAKMPFYRPMSRVTRSVYDVGHHHGFRHRWSPSVSSQTLIMRVYSFTVFS